jgi:diacylglycerol kinase (ATP)
MQKQLYNSVSLASAWPIVPILQESSNLKFMKPQKSLHSRARLGSIGFAMQGILRLVKQEPNAKLHLMATIVVITAGFVRHLSKVEWTELVFAIALVWMAEAFNTAIEILCDLWCKEEYHPKVKVIKDVSAAGVLIASLASFIIGIIVFFL